MSSEAKILFLFVLQSKKVIPEMQTYTLCAIINPTI